MENNTKEEVVNDEAIVNSEEIANQQAEPSLPNVTEELMRENAKLKDQMLRAFADSDNLRKRFEKEIQDTNKYAVTSFAKDLIEAMENLYRALSNIGNVQIEESAQLKNIYDGIDLTKQEFEKTFAKHGIARIDPKPGDAFDHNLHQAVAQIDSPDHESGQIVSVMQAGYSIHDRLLRPAMVTVKV